MRYLLLSDLHGNWDALEAVLADGAGHFDRIVSCGDLVGYGPDPNAVVDWARENLHAVVRGNHDRACCGLDDLEWFNPTAQEATRWTMAHLTRGNLEWLRRLPRGPLEVAGFNLAHGSPIDEDEYLMTPSDAAGVYGYLEASLTFIGHTHLQGGFAWFGGQQQILGRPTPGRSRLSLRLAPDGVYLINPGSVGQPRDHDPRAAYLLYDADEQRVELRRVAYDHEAVHRKIVQAGLPPALGVRLGAGR